MNSSQEHNHQPPAPVTPASNIQLKSMPDPVLSPGRMIGIFGGIVSPFGLLLPWIIYELPTWTAYFYGTDPEIIKTGYVEPVLASIFPIIGLIFITLRRRLFSLVGASLGLVTFAMPLIFIFHLMMSYNGLKTTSEEALFIIDTVGYGEIFPFIGGILLAIGGFLCYASARKQSIGLGLTNPP